MNQLTLPTKVTLTENSLTFTNPPTEEDIKNTYQALTLMESASLFYIGDFLNQIEIIKGRTYAELMAKSNYAKKTLWTAKNVCSFIPPTMRVKGMSYSMHKEVLELTKDADKAVGMLKEAKEEGLTLSEIRKSYRLANAEVDNTPDVIDIYKNEQFLQLEDCINTINHILESSTLNLAGQQRDYILIEITNLYNKAVEVLK